VLNIAVSPGIQVTLRPADGPAYPPHDRLVLAALEEYPPGQAVAVQVSSGVPAGSGLGTSSAVAVGLIGALLATRGEECSPLLVAREAHRLETEVLGEECGLQDQLAAARGGINYIVVDRYPDFAVESVPDWPQLGELLSTVYLGRPHISAQVHRDVIERGDRAALAAMRLAGEAARAAVMGRDLRGLAEAMRQNDEAQRNLHPDVVGEEALEAIDLARRCGAIAWKVNGAGGDGGSLAVLHDSPAARSVFDDEVEKTGRWRVLQLRMSGGLVVGVNPPRN
jgi:D-glycero-alpha-D-manno-heptose-7-phosphate kinase